MSLWHVGLEDISLRFCWSAAHLEVVCSLSAGSQYCRERGGTAWHTACFSMPVRSNVKLGDVCMQLLFEKLSRRPCHPLQMRYVVIAHSLLKGRSQNVS